jgi:hypothetical protein
VAGGFYPASPEALRRKVEGYLAAADEVPLPGRLVAVIAPHAGYDYSGPCAGWAYRQLEGSDFESVVLVGGHSDALPYASVYASGAYRTPLGDAAVDAELARAMISASDALRDDRRLHGSRDHALEVHVPFIQVVLPRAWFVPVYYNRTDPQTAARVGAGIAQAIKGRKAVIVCSTDLSHYPDAATAEKADRRILDAICALDSKEILDADAEILRKYGSRNLQCSACCLGSVMAAVEAARRLGATGAKVLNYDHSGNHVRRDTGRVVGYGAVAIYAADGEETAPKRASSAAAPRRARDGGGVPSLPKGAAAPERGRTLSDEERDELLALARRSIESAFEGEPVPVLESPTEALDMRTGAFVTLRVGDQLRGCIGTFDRSRPLWQVVADRARCAAFKDNRFEPLTPAELDGVEIEISVLSPLRRLDDPLDLRFGTDGVWIVGPDGRSGTYLPQVAEHFRTKEEFISHCCAHKAWLPADAWRDPQRATVYAYTAEVFSERGETR